ncbi:CPBP family intramembrane glutamic endopeptidase [Flavobacterium silvaticum]|uniref:CPBP family intramembrane metalloprotease n=1 Tax=Flavobacterium silvaticum TaxID=1852020 RepID=A0A972FNJ1_9FLAO|nr:CPBP family intramembrane glutamic endopeptidase [Flavobacterium silvaticum]NMH28952.1 CPBP family intramembrane metalloprotease [Flavobacterium silvaticum]
MFIEQAYKGDNSLWKVILTTILSGGVFFLNILVFIFVPDDFLEQAYAAQSGPPSIVNFLIVLLPFAFLLGLLFLLVRFLHERSILSLTTSRPKIDFKRFWFAFFLIVLSSLILFAIEYFSDPSAISVSLNMPRFLIFLLISLLLLPLQIGFEEYFFRGFLMQQIGIASRNRWLPLVLTSVFFGVCHAANPEINEMGMWLLVYYIGTGFLLGIIVLMDQGLELTLGYHFGNNLIASILISYQHSALQSETIFKYVNDPDPAEMLHSMLIGMVISYPLLILILAKVFKWTNWKQRLFGKVNPPIIESELQTQYHENAHL